MESPNTAVEHKKETDAERNYLVKSYPKSWDAGYEKQMQCNKNRVIITNKLRFNNFILS